MKDLTLLIMAAGMGSRFGGLKQIEPVGPNNEFILDYSIYDAIRAGFNRVVFIIKEENYDLFRETVGRRIENVIEVDYAFQDISDIPSSFKGIVDRIKPWGTAHAIFSAKNKIAGDFLVINADDFYGMEAYFDAKKFFESKKDNEYAIIGYKASNTLSDIGAGKRGVCEVKNDYLTSIIECSVEKKDNKIVATPLSGGDSFFVDGDKTVSMNMWALDDSLFTFIEKDINLFLEKNKENLEKCEYLIPEVIGDMVEKNSQKVKIVPTNSVWQGITFKEDKELLVNTINELIDSNKYPKNLWMN